MRRKVVFHAQKDHGQDQPRTPASHRVEHKSDVLGGVARDFFSQESGAKIKTHDGHPGEHGDGGEVAKVAGDLADVIVLKVGIEYSEEKNSEESDTDDIAQYNPSMETVELRDNPIDNEDDEQGEKTDNSKECENDDHGTVRQPIKRFDTSDHHHPHVLGVICRGHVLKTDLRYVQVPGTVVHPVHHLHNLYFIFAYVQDRVMLGIINQDILTVWYFIFRLNTVVTGIEDV